MNKAPSKQNRRNRVAKRTHFLPLVAAGSGLAALPANAIELGDISVQSRLGQPLRASIAYALAPNEQISDSCVSLGLGRSASGLPGAGRATISVTNGTILISGSAPLREPMVATSIVIDCPYTANLSREYLMFIDPPGAAYEARFAAEPAPVATSATATPGSTRTPAARAAASQPIGKSTRYRVQRGDSLSVIAQRIENRSIGLWAAVDAIFAANPQAFMDNDPNKLKAGSWLEIPSFDGSEPVVAAAPSAAATEPAAIVQSSVYDGFESGAMAEPSEATVTAESQVPVASTAEPATIDETTDATRDLRPGDVIFDGDRSSAAAGNAGSDRIAIPDTELDGPVATSSSPNVPVATLDTSATTEPSSSSWLLWFAGGGIAIIFALLLFGGRLRQRFGSSPSSPGAAVAIGGARDADTERFEALADDEYDLDDDSPTAENLALDADLIMGTGLEEGTDMEVAEDFGFAGPTEVDVELPFEPLAEIPTTQTDIIHAAHTVEHSILDSEILPEDDDYDMSVIIDATKMPQPEDVTERDLQAVEVATPDDGDTTDSYTINRETDFDILEQDYEHELTATQALNKEIARAAEQLAGRMEGEEAEDVTSEMPLATVTELDVTAQMTRHGETVADPDDTVESDALTANTSADEKTAEMPAARNDDTVEMDVEGGKVDTRAG